MTELEVAIDNVGGIDEATFAFDEPVSVIAGPNATNKTSLLQAIAFALGRDEVSIKSGVDEATVTLSVDGETVTRTARRSDRDVTAAGEGYLTDPDNKRLFDYYSCLLEFNPLRSAVRQSEDVEPVLKEPIDIDALERRRSAKMDEKRSLQRNIEQADDVESEIEERKETIQRKRERKNELEAQLEELQDEQAESTDPDGELNSVRDERTDLVLKRDKYERQISDLEDAIDRLVSKQEDKREMLERQRELADQYDIEELKADRQAHQEEIDDISQRQDVLQSVLTANREMVNPEFTGTFGKEIGLMKSEVDCWVCGQSTDMETIESALDDLQDLVQQDKQKRREVEPRIEEVDEQISEAKEAQRRVTDLETDLSEIDQKLDDRRESLETKRDQIAELRRDIGDLDERIEELESKQSSEITDLTEEIEETQVELQTVRHAIKTERSRIDTLETERREREEKKERIDELTAEITDLTDRIENLEHHLREEFNEAMDDLVSRLDFPRIERIWLDGNLDLVIARDADGSVREDTPESLAESEREVVGLVLALAGYIAYELDEVAPVLLIDTLGALDAKRTERFLEYFGDKSEFLIASVLPEVAGPLDRPTVNPADQTRQEVLSD